MVQIHQYNSTTQGLEYETKVEDAQHECSTILSSYTKKVKIWTFDDKGSEDEKGPLGLCCGKNRVVVAEFRYRRISVATLNLPWRQTKTLIFEKNMNLNFQICYFEASSKRACI